MTLVEFVPPTPHPLWKLCPQMGITDVVVKVNPELTGLADPWRLSTLRSIVERLKVEGLNVVGLEGDPFDMSPIKEYGALDCISHVEHVDHVELNDAQQPETTLHVSARSTRLNNPVNHVNPVKNKDDIREEALSHYRELLESMGKLGIKLLCYNFMVGKGWSRTGVREGRGGAKATYFSLDGFLTGFTRFTGLHELGAEPPDPDNPVNPVNPVQTLEDAARHFGKRIAFIHVRDVEGDKTDFTELFHDQGDTDQFALMRTYRELGLDVPVRGDHVPEMAYDRVLTPEGTPGYFTLGRLFANGYLKALLKSIA